MTKKLLIRAEDKNRWERRAPIVPTDLADILEATGARAFVEKSTNAFSAWISTRQPGPHPVRAWPTGRSSSG
jgi:hypothetical protein